MNIPVVTEDFEYLQAIANRYRDYRKPTEAQKKLVELADKKLKTENDLKIIRQMLKVERANEKQFLENQKLQNLLSSEKKEARKLRDRKIAVEGAAQSKARELGLMINATTSFKDAFDALVRHGLISERDITLFEDEVKREEPVQAQMPLLEPQNQEAFQNSNTPPQS